MGFHRSGANFLRCSILNLIDWFLPISTLNFKDKVLMFSIMQPKADQTEKCFFIYEKNYKWPEATYYWIYKCVLNAESFSKVAKGFKIFDLQNVVIWEKFKRAQGFLNKNIDIFQTWIIEGKDENSQRLHVLTILIWQLWYVLLKTEKDWNGLRLHISINTDPKKILFVFTQNMC